MVKNVIFKGGGVLGIAYAGALQELEANGTLKNIEKVAGTSAGAIVAALVSLKYTAAQIKEIVNKTNFANFEDRENPMRILSRYGLYSGDAFLEWMQEQIIARGFNRYSTFADLKNKGCLDLHVFATDLNTRSLARFSFDDSPNVIVAEAIRASMSIPFFFKAHRFSNNIPNMHIYVDGGTVYNYPLSCFDNGSIDEETLGLFLTDLNDVKTPSDLGFDELGKYIRALAETALDSQNIDVATDVAEMSRTIMIDDLGISATNFKLNDQQKAALFQSGIKAISESKKFEIANG